MPATERLLPLLSCIQMTWIFCFWRMYSFKGNEFILKQFTKWWTFTRPFLKKNSWHFRLFLDANVKTRSRIKCTEIKKVNTFAFSVYGKHLFILIKRWIWDDGSTFLIYLIIWIFSSRCFKQIWHAAFCLNPPDFPLFSDWCVSKIQALGALNVF